MSSCGDLTGMRACEVNALIEGRRGSHQGFERHGSGQIGEPNDALGSCDSKDAHCGHGLGAVEQSEAFFGSELEQLDTGAVQRFTTLHALALEKRFTFADTNER